MISPFALLALSGLVVSVMGGKHEPASFLTPMCGANRAPPGPAIVELLHIQDMSAYVDETQIRRAVPEAVKALQTAFPGSNIGLVTTVDKPIAPFGATTDWCYKLRMPLSTDVEEFADRLGNAELGNGGDPKNDQIEALMVGALDKSVGWSDRNVNDSDDDAMSHIRIALVITNTDFHVANTAHGLPPNSGTADIQCSTEDYPSTDQVLNGLMENDVIPLFLVGDTDEGPYKKLLEGWAITGIVTRAKFDDAEDVAAKILQGIANILCNYVYDTTTSTGTITGTDTPTTTTYTCTTTTTTHETTKTHTCTTTTTSNSRSTTNRTVTRQTSTTTTTYTCTTTAKPHHPKLKGTKANQNVPKSEIAKALKVVKLPTI